MPGECPPVIRPRISENRSRDIRNSGFWSAARLAKSGTYDVARRLAFGCVGFFGEGFSFGALPPLGYLAQPRPGPSAGAGFFSFDTLKISIKHDGTLRSMDGPLGAEARHARHQPRRPAVRLGNGLAARDRLSGLSGGCQRRRARECVARFVGRGARAIPTASTPISPPADYQSEDGLLTFTSPVAFPLSRRTTPSTRSGFRRPRTAAGRWWCCPSGIPARTATWAWRSC